MFTEAEVCKQLFAALKNKGYPEGSMVFEYILDTPHSLGGEKRRYIVDAAILDMLTGIPLMFFEVKSRIDDRIISLAIKQLKMYAAKAYMPVKMYIVYPAIGGVGFKIADVSSLVYSDNNSETSGRLVFWEGGQFDKEFPTYDLLVKGVANKFGVLRENVTTRKLDALKIVSYVVDGILLSLFLTDFLVHNLHLRWENLAVLGAAVIVALAPYYESVKYNGVEIAQKKTDKKENRG